MKRAILCISNELPEMPFRIPLDGVDSTLTLAVVVERNTDGAAVMTVVLSDDLLRAQFPEASIVVGACGHQVCGIGAKGAVPNPPLVLM
jgi:hypothetical protein